MRKLPALMAERIASGDFTGDARSMARVTVQKTQLGLYENTGQLYSSVLFPSTAEGARELPNVKSVNWERTVDGATGSFTLELYNTKPLPPGTGADTSGSFDLIGYYTFNRGRSSYAQTTWGHDPNDWQDTLVSDRLIRIYQGYGFDYGQLPEHDPNMLLMFVGLIDDVTYTADGLITVEGRDFAGLLADQIMFPPVVPAAHYPLKFSQFKDVANPPVVTPALDWHKPKFDQSSNAQNGGAEVQFGHHGVDVVDIAQLVSYWLSTGYDVPNHPSSFVWWQGTWTGDPISTIQIGVRGGRYRVYLSVYTDKAKGGKITGWNGSQKIPYKPAPPTAPDNGSGITYSQTGIAEYGAWFTFTFPAVTGITKIRITFTNLYKTEHQPHIYRAALRDLKVANAVTRTSDGGTHKEGSYGDYTDIVKLLLAYGGFYWPENGRQYLTGDHVVSQTFKDPDPYLSQADVTSYMPPTGTPGRIWGDLQMSGTSGPDELGIEIWDKKPLLDGINYVKDVLGFFFTVDEQGAAIFRAPNVFQLGNWQSDEDGLNTIRTKDHVVIRDDESILGLRAKISSRNMREWVFIANTNGDIGAVAQGRIPNSAGLRRVGGWTDQNFEKTAECQRMADMITLRQLFTYRTDTLRIPANPALQIDDQVQIFERTTGDAYFHYVRSISSSWDIEGGKWTYDVSSAWLGEDPEKEWAFRTDSLSPDVSNFLGTLLPAAGTTILVDWGATGWKYLAQPQTLSTSATNTAPVETQQFSARTVDDSTWKTGQTAIGWAHPAGPYYGTVPRAIDIPVKNELWLRRTVGCVRKMQIFTRADNFAFLYVNGHKVADIVTRDLPTEVQAGPFLIPDEWLDPSGDQVIALHVQDTLSQYMHGDILLGDVRILGVP